MNVTHGGGQSRGSLSSVGQRPSDLLGDLNAVEAKHVPDTLYVSGDERLLTHGRRVSVVGSRKVSPDGAKRAASLTKALVEADIIVVSGLAAGVDTVAHKTAIASGGRTVAVLGTPLDEFYPKQNKALQQEIMRDHVAVSQFPFGYPATPKNFPMRNRTMALLSDATIIVEASERSGTRHQGWEALRLGREVFILESLLKEKNISWTAEMVEYGAVSLTRENLSKVLANLPALSNRERLAF